jgi:hypothetical protein
MILPTIIEENQKERMLKGILLSLVTFAAWMLAS